MNGSGCNQMPLQSYENDGYAKLKTIQQSVDRTDFELEASISLNLDEQRNVRAKFTS